MTVLDSDRSFILAVERPSNFEGFRADAMSPLLRISPALMQGENLSMQSLARSSRGVGVTDLREALEGRGCVSNPALVAPTISTLERASSRRAGADSFSPNELQLKQSRSRRRPATSGTGEVRDVLERLGIGKPQSGSLLRASFPALQKLNDRFVPCPPSCLPLLTLPNRPTIGDAPS
jgi:protein EFR3